MILEATAVGVRYGPTRALTDVSFGLGEGVTALLGVNGAGKTSLLSVCAGVLAPQPGAVTLCSHLLYARSGRRQALRSVALMPQQVVFPARLTASDVVTYAGWLKGLRRSEASRRARTSLEAVGLADQSDRPCSTLSGGMTRRLALAQALVSEPDVLLLDEPSTGLDPEQRRGMVELIRGLRSSVLMSSHVVEDVADLADRVLVLHEGRLVVDGDLADLTSGVRDAAGRSAVEAGFLRAIGREVDR